MASNSRALLGAVSVLEDSRVDPSGVADSTAGILAVIALAEANGKPVEYPSGIYRTTATILHLGEVYASSEAFISSDHEGVALQVGTGVSEPRAIRCNLPAVEKATKSWAAGNVGGTDVGIVIDSVQSSLFEIPEVVNFTTGLLMTAENANGNVSNTVTLGYLRNNAVNLRLAPGNTGWVNQNTFLGGRFAHFSSEGTDVAGTAHIQLDDQLGAGASVPNGNTFVGPSIESPIVVEHFIICEGSYNQWTNARFEQPGVNTRRVKFDTNTARHNVIWVGVQAEQLTVTETNGAAWNRVVGQSIRWSGSSLESIMALRNTSSDALPCLTVLGDSIDHLDNSAVASNWNMAVSANEYFGKRATDAVAAYRVRLDHLNGVVDLAAPLGGIHSLSFNDAGSLLIDNTPVGTAPPLSGTTAARPATLNATTDIGVEYFDTDLVHPIWWTGTGWVDSNGAAV